MELKSVHEPEEKVMSVSDVWDDAQRIRGLLQQNVSKQKSPEINFRAESASRLKPAITVRFSVLELLAFD